MKRITSLLLALSLFLLLGGCGPTTSSNPSPPAIDKSTMEPIRIGGLSGPTSIGMVHLMETNETGSSTLPYAFSLAATADELVPKLLQGELDMAAIPANLAAILYQNSKGAICVLAVNTLGVLSIVEKGGDTVHSMADLKGKTIYATGKGTVPEYVLRHLLTANGLNPDTDVTIEFRSEPTEIVSLLASQSTGIAMLPQPFVTVAQGKVEGLRIAVDLTDAWDAMNTNSTLITGVMVARRDFVNTNPEVITQFLNEYKDSIQFTQENVTQAAALTEKYGIVKAAIAEKAIPNCNLSFLAGNEMKETLSAYLEVLYAQNKASVGNALPDDGFYFGS